MGTNCRLIAKLNGDTYYHRCLDRLYVFNLRFKEHYNLYEGADIHDLKDAWLEETKFTPQYLMQWCQQRHNTILLATPKELSVKSVEKGYHLNYINQALQFAKALLIRYQQVEWVALYDDMHDFYFDLKNNGKEIIDI